MNTLSIILSGGAGGEGGGPQFFIMLALIFGVMYFFMIRPQSKTAKEMKKFRAELSKGDRIVTIGGVHGKIVGTSEATVMIEVESGHKLKLERSAISMEYTSGTGESELANPKK